MLVAQAASRVEAGEPQQALAVLAKLQEAEVRSYQPYWVTLAHVLAAAGDRPAAQRAMQTAMGLTEDAAVRAFLAGALEA